MTRRDAFRTINGGLALAAAGRSAPAPAGRLKQSVARWCYSRMGMDELCRAAADIGLSGIDLVNPEDWPTVRKYGLTAAMVPGAGAIPDGWNRKENHDRLEKEMLENIARAAAAKVPNVITFSGNRARPVRRGGQSQLHPRPAARQAGRRGCRRHHLHGAAEQQGGSQRLPVRPHGLGRGGSQGVDSPRVKLLYDIYHMQIMEGRRHPHHPRTIFSTSPISTPAACRGGTSWTTRRNSSTGPSPKPSPI